ncbi:hypothetical protein F5Y16DRAFT_364151 [Xylariaceae sp. FL0255]|nr:hypothetical protein F5Y16DRAFT_364151 [Xylariaceae sp. FL0255]
MAKWLVIALCWNNRILVFTSVCEYRRSHICCEPILARIIVYCVCARSRNLVFGQFEAICAHGDRIKSPVFPTPTSVSLMQDDCFDSGN